MVKYTANDIIKRATQIADMENTDFISDYEKLALLNENWQILYQKMIDANDRTWIKDCIVESGMLLPHDFYQMANLYVKPSKEQITKMNGSQTEGYDIRNGRIFLSRQYRDSEIVMEYWPSTPSLTIKDQLVDSPFDNTIKDAYRSLYIDSDNIIKDVDDSSVSYKIGTGFYDYAIFSNGALGYIDEDYEAFGWWNFEGEIQLPTEEDELIPLIIENELYFYSNAYKKIYDVNYNEYEEIDLELPTLEDDHFIYIYADSELEDVYAFTATSYYYNNEEEIELANRKLKLIWKNGNPYCIIRKTNKVVKIYSDGVEPFKTDYTPITFVSDKYILSKKLMSDYTYLEGYSEDTLLDLPNNLYFIVLAYMLAIAFMSKQGNDTTSVSSLYSAASDQLFDSLSNDNNASYQIRDVYSDKCSLFY